MAVYDGHGGTGVANYLKDHLHEFILAQPEYRCEIMPPGPLVRHHLQQRFHITTDTELWRVINGPTKNNDRQRQTPLRDLWPPRHLIRVMRRHDFNIQKKLTKTRTSTPPWQRYGKDGELAWNCWQLRTWIHDNHCYLSIICDTGQHSQSLRCSQCEVEKLKDQWSLVWNDDLMQSTERATCLRLCWRPSWLLTTSCAGDCDCDWGEDDGDGGDDKWMMTMCVVMAMQQNWRGAQPHVSW